MPKRKASFYGVRVGKQPGIYEDWEVCKTQVLGFPGSEYKGFQTRAEAENYVNGTTAGFWDLPVSNTSIDQIEASSKLEVYRHHLSNPASSRGNASHVPPDKVTLPQKKFSGILLKQAAVLKEQLSQQSETIAKDPSQVYKLTEENGQQFVVFESLEDFDSHFDALCHSSSKHSGAQIFETVSKNHESETKSHTAVPTRQLQAKIAAEDDTFVYFEDENELIEFLQPYFTDAKQRSVFTTVPQLQNGIYQLEFDGACKGNPGLAGAGALIRCPHGSVVVELTQFLGIATNNIAEYRALLLGLKAALSKGIKRVQAKGDSKLVCLQVIGAWKVENEKLIPLHEEIKSLTVLFESFSITHVRREYNSDADALANKAVVSGEPLREVAKPQPDCCFSG